MPIELNPCHHEDLKSLIENGTREILVAGDYRDIHVAMSLYDKNKDYVLAQLVETAEYGTAYLFQLETFLGGRSDG